ncbi:MAG: S-layer homology domain-containing protein, partial [Thermoanaerobaculia bacterium]
MKTFSPSRRVLFGIGLCVLAVLGGAATAAVQDTCGPFTDVSAAICPYVLEMYYLGITAGTSATTYSPDNPMTRGQAAVFVSKGINQTLARSSRRAALGQWWTPQGSEALGLTTVGSLPFAVVSDGADLWVTVTGDGVVARVRASDGKLLESWTGATNALAVMSAMGKVFLTTNFSPILYMIDPTQPAGAISPVSDPIGSGPYGLAFDGSRIWITSSTGAVFIVQPGPTLPWPVTKVTKGFQTPFSIVFDGTNIWVGDQLAESLFKLDSSGAILQTVPLSGEPAYFAFDGKNLWVPLQATQPPAVAVVQASTGAVLATLTGNGMTGPIAAAFDGQRVLVTAGSDRVSLWKAADFSP